VGNPIWRSNLPRLLSVLLALQFFWTFEPAPGLSQSVRSSAIVSGIPGTSPCSTSGRQQILITCEYPAAKDRSAGPRIILKRANLSFETQDENHMRIELTFANVGAAGLSETYSSYLAIDDETTGDNYFRRLLAQVDLSKVRPGAELTFTERHLIGALPAGHYRVHLWIPLSRSHSAADVGQPLRLANLVAEGPDNSLNRLAAFSVMAGSL
jgi:hypothetical protein